METKPRTICLIEGCESFVFAGGVCQPHYDRLRRYGDSNYTKPVRHPSSTCAVPECTRPRCGTKYCQSHEKRRETMAETDPKFLLPIGKIPRAKKEKPSKPQKANRVPICTYGSCMAETVSINMCQRHYDVVTAPQRKERMRRHYVENKAYYKAKKQRRDYREKQSTPKWLQPHHKWIMEQYYKACVPGFEVDHIVPLNGELVSGLHVPWNLQILSSIDNRAKSNRFNFEEYREKWLRKVS